MSHQVSLNLQIANLEILKNAVTNNGWAFHEGKTQAQAWDRSTQKCDHVISVPNERYEIAVIKQSDGSYSFGMESAVRSKYERPLQEGVALEAARMVAHKQGYRMNQSRNEKNELVIRLAQN